MRVREMCMFAPVTCRRDASARDVAALMRERHVGDVIVVEDRDGGVVPIGVLTDRDLAVELMAKGIDPASVCAGDLLTRECVTVMASDLAYDAVWQMRRCAIRRLPVVDAQGHLVGILTMDDLNRFLAQELNDLTQVVPRQSDAERRLR